MQKNRKRKHNYFKAILIGLSPVFIVLLIVLLFDIFLLIYRLIAIGPFFIKAYRGAHINNVIHYFGEPHKRCYYEHSNDCYISGFSKPSPEMKGDVLIYVRGDAIIYVFYDKNAIVTDKYFGGS